MTNKEMSYDRSVFLSYQEIQENAHRQKVKFFLDKKDEILNLEYRDRQFIELDFMLSIFEIGDYERYLEFVDKQIEAVIRNNIYRFKDKDIYYILLQNKALSLFHSYEDEKSLSIAKQLRRMNLESQIPEVLILKILKRKKRAWSSHLNGLAIFLILFTAVILFFELIMVRPFLSNWIGTVEMIRNLVILSSFACLFINQVLVHFISRSESKKK